MQWRWHVYRQGVNFPFFRFPEVVGNGSERVGTKRTAATVTAQNCFH